MSEGNHIFPPPPENSSWRRFKEWLGFAPKDWITSVLSVLAICISLITAYFSLLRVNDDVRMVVSRFPQLNIETDKLLTLEKEFTLAFINAGNRPAVVVSVALLVEQANTDKQCSGDATYFDTKIEPLVIKASEIQTLKVGIERVQENKQKITLSQGKWIIPMSPSNLKSEFVEVQTCVVIELSTPSESFERVMVKINQQSGRRSAGMPFIDGERTGQPFAIVKKASTIFSN